jgi:iron complex outermembrane receptor protein
VPSRFAFGEVGWKAAGSSGLSTALEVRWMDDVFTTDLNNESAAAFTLFNWHATLEQQQSKWRFREFVRVDNLLDRKYVGSVIVNASNGQYYEPAPGRSLLIGFSAQH